MIKLSELKKLHDQGFALIYLKPKSKRPFEKDWTKGERKSWEELENSFEKSYNAGVRLGTASRLKSGKYLAAIDCDVKALSRKAKLEMNEKLRELGLDLTTAPVVASGRGNGSKHIYVQTDAPLKPRKFARSAHLVKVAMPGERRALTEREEAGLTEAEKAQGMRLRPAWEISLMGVGQQVVLPGSVHPDTGMEYAWASPLTMKYLPTFKPPVGGEANESSRESDWENEATVFTAVDVDLAALPPYLKESIEEGFPQGTRSEGILSVAMSLCRARLTDQEILSVLSNPDYGVSEKPFEERTTRLGVVSWLIKYALKPARYNTDPMRMFENRPKKMERLSEEKAKEEAQEIEDDHKEAFPDVTKQGAPKPTLRNVVHALFHHLGGEVVGMDEFSKRIYFLMDTPYGGKKGREIRDEDDLALRYHLATHFRFEPGTSTCFEAHMLIAYRNRYHPVRQYLESLKWDGKPRLDTWLRDAFGATGPDDYLRAVSRKILVAAVARVYEPGCKFDHVLVLEGNQGEGKSMSLGILASQNWFTDNLGDIHHKDVVDQMTGKWIVELSELASIRGRESEYVKAFLSRQVDRVRLPYGKRSEDYARQSIFIGSTNSSEYLTDETGNRRYWPVAMRSANRKWLIQNRCQLWAEALMRYEIGETLYLTKETEALARKEQDKRFEVDEWEIEIKKIVNKDLNAIYHITEIWRAINLTNGNGHPSWVDSRRIGRILQRLGFKRKSIRDGKEVLKAWKRVG